MAGHGGSSVPTNSPFGIRLTLEHRRVAYLVHRFRQHFRRSRLACEGQIQFGLGKTHVIAGFSRISRNRCTEGPALRPAWSQALATTSDGAVSDALGFARSVAIYGDIAARSYAMKRGRGVHERTRRSAATPCRGIRFTMNTSGQCRVPHRLQGWMRGRDGIKPRRYSPHVPLGR